LQGDEPLDLAELADGQARNRGDDLRPIETRIAVRSGPKC
jgi:hypothetical protein